jgi:putative flavoprotein involved in K+ transport
VRNTTVVILGAGQAGLAMSSCLRNRSVDHVLLERGSSANSWRTERWDSLRLLTPNWLSRLPGWSYKGDDPDGYMTAAQVVEYLTDYRKAIEAPVHENTTVLSVKSGSTGFVTHTSNGPWRSRAVVVATGACSQPRIPTVAQQLPNHINQIAPIHYRGPTQTPDGAVLVVGASASGAQIADELARSGRSVTIAVGEHVRLPRTYRGRDIHWWMDLLGQLNESYTEMADISRARRLPSLQLIGSPTKRDLDVNALTAAGVAVVGRFVGIAAGRAQLSGSLANICASADLKQGRFLDQIDEFVLNGGMATFQAIASSQGVTAALTDPIRPEPTVIRSHPTHLNLSSISTVIWATGFRPTYPWLCADLLDRKGAIIHDGGVMQQPGMYVLGLPFTRRRKSSFLDGVGPDAIDLTNHLANFLGSRI